MKLTRVRAVVGAVLLALLASLAGTAPASAAPQGSTFLLPPAPKLAAVAALAAVSPTISPADSSPDWLLPDVEYVNPGVRYQCLSGYLCPAVWDVTRSQWKVFHLYYCRTYSLYNWHGGGYYVDYQTDNVPSYFYGQSWNWLDTIRPDLSGKQYQYDWEPVWYIVNC